MRIDVHQHFWRYNSAEYGWIDDSMRPLRRDFLPPDLQPELTAAGFDGCIAVQARQSLEETRWLLSLAASSPFVLGVIGWVDLQSSDVKSQLREFQNTRLLGVRHIVQAEPDERFLLRPEFLRGIAVLEEFNLTYDILVYPQHLPVAAEFVSLFPSQRFVLDHLAKPFIKKHEMQPWEADLERLASFPNVFCKLSGLVTEADWRSWKPADIAPYLKAALECFGAERLMIGSDWPVCTVAASYAETMQIVADFMNDSTGAACEAVLGGTAARFWQLKP